MAAQNNIIEYINKHNKNIKFTMETTSNNEINYLHYIISTKQNIIKYNIYGKPTQTIKINKKSPISTRKNTTKEQIIPRIIKRNQYNKKTIKQLQTQFKTNIKIKSNI